MKKLILIVLVSLSFASVFAQKGVVKGVVKDATLGETLIGANVLIKEGVGTITDFDGNFTLSADYGSYTITVSYVGYEPYTKKITVSAKPVVLNVKLNEVSLNEVMIVAD
ncbi:MAG: PEGA domain-containing protein, partial [Chlorobi bacterium]|nr:PEGA domain-containing protein [Chlorobiota bacterium]